MDSDNISFVNIILVDFITQLLTHDIKSTTVL